MPFTPNADLFCSPLTRFRSILITNTLFPFFYYTRPSLLRRTTWPFLIRVVHKYCFSYTICNSPNTACPLRSCTFYKSNFFSRTTVLAVRSSFAPKLFLGLPTVPYIYLFSLKEHTFTMSCFVSPIILIGQPITTFTYFRFCCCGFILIILSNA